MRGARSRRSECHETIRQRGFLGWLLSGLGGLTTPVGWGQTNGFLPSEPANFSEMSWTGAFDAMHVKFSTEYAFGDWKNIEWPGRRDTYRPRIERLENLGLNLPEVIKHHCPDDRVYHQPNGWPERPRPLPAPCSCNCGTNVVLTFSTISGATYQVYCSDALSSTNWSEVSTPITGNGSLTNVQHSDIRPQRFYRVRAMLP